MNLDINRKDIQLYWKYYEFCNDDDISKINAPDHKKLDFTIVDISKEDYYLII